MKIDVEGSLKDPRLRSRIVSRVQKALSRLPAEPATAHVSFIDVNGPKGGVGSRCALTVSLPARRTVRVEDNATTPWLAFSGAVDALEERLRRQSEREATRRRRPKKYYVAKQLLAPEPGSPALEPRPSGRRQRRSDVL